MKNASSYIIMIFDLHEPQKLAEFDERPLFFWRVSMHLVDGVAGQVVVITRLWWDDNPPEILGRRQEQTHPNKNNYQHRNTPPLETNIKVNTWNKTHITKQNKP